MYNIKIKIPDQEVNEGKLIPGVYRVGSSPASHLQIDRPSVSGRHAQIAVTDTDVKIMDLDSSNGTFLDGERVGNEPVKALPGSVIKIGDVEILLVGPEVPKGDIEVKENIPTPRPRTDPQRKKELTSELKKVVEKALTSGNDSTPVLRISGIPADARPLVQEIKKRAHIELITRLNLKRLAVSGVSEDDLAEKAKKAIHDILSELSIPLPSGVNIKIVEQELIHEAIGLGPLEDLIDMDDITEIMVNGPDHVYVEKDGVLLRTDTAFADNNQVQAAIERIVSPLGRRIDESSPMVDARLQDGSRVNAIIPPLSLVGPTITIRKFAKTPFEVQDLINFGSMTPAMATFLDACVKVRKNIIISGGTGSGKTTLLNVVSSFLPMTERIVTIEDAAELQLGQEHVVRLEARPPNIEGKGEVAIRDLVRNSLRMRPDRIVVGECRSGEALDMLQAMNTGHDGSLTTIHANSPRDALSRLETLVMMAGFDLPLKAIREQIASAVTIIVQADRYKDGTRKVTNISEVTKMEGEIITMQDIFVFNHEGWTKDGKIAGRHTACGNIPTFMEEITRSKIDLDISIFRDEREGGLV
jgi:pilus assembly protein CpaF